MGCDGGTIPRRDELVRTKKKPEQKDRFSEMAFKWKHCALSQEALVKPIVACRLGRLYNKETILEFLLDKSKFEQAAGCDHIRGLKDVKELNLTDNPARRPKDAKKGDGFIDPSVADYICPIVGLEMSGQYRFIFIWACGCVISERAYKEVKCDTCQKCGKEYKWNDMIVLNGTDDEVAESYARMVERRALAKLLKSQKPKKASKHKATDVEEAGVFKKPMLTAPSTSTSSSTSTQQNRTEPKLNGHHINGKAKSLDGKTKSSDGKGVKGSSKLPKAGSSSSEKSSSGSKVVGSKVSSIQDNPKNSETFKSLFTTSAAEKLQDTPHWITYNPMYY